MILKRLQIKNIRSYKDATIDFPKGSTLLMGDIGSGKTSILLAIEFALFGLQPSQRGSSLLRNNEEEAFVSLDFEIDDKEISIERKIKKTSKAISQVDAAISIDNERFEGSITEVKNKVLTLLSYPPEFAKKTNDLYKFTVYTPQEEMKQIILESPETRLNTLRHVFGIDKYKRISENLSVLGVRLRQEIRVKEAQLGNVDQKNTEIKEKEVKLQEEKTKIIEVDLENEKVQALKDLKQNEIRDLETKITEKNNLEKEKAKTEIMASSKQDTINNYNKEISLLQQQIEEGKKFTYNEEEIKNLQTRIKTQEEILKQTNDEYIALIGRLQSQEGRKKEIDSLKMKMQGLQKCPTCLQEVNETYKENIISKADQELEMIEENNQLDQKTKTELISKLETIKKQIEAFKTTMSETEILKVKLQSLQEKEVKAKEIEENKSKITKDLGMIKDQLKRITDLISEFDQYTPAFEQKNKELQEIIKQEQDLAIKKAEINKEIQFLEHQIKTLKEEIVKLNEIKSQINHLKELESWLSNKFAQLIKTTEKNVMLKLREEFSVLFNEWFSVLVEDGLRVRLDESFSPIIEQQDYEIEYSFLSGGERTAVALAYRLALNQVINSILSKIKTHDLVILDEPTDGFSETQLDKIREVLGELKAKQLLLVSHEQKIEGFVDNIIRFKKTEGVTNIEN